MNPQIYQYNDPENCFGILDDEVKDISQILPPLYFDNMRSEKENEILKKFREEVKEYVLDSPDSYLQTDLYLSRFLMARDYKIPESKIMFINAMKWRIENDVANISERFEKNVYFKILTSYWPASMMMKDHHFWTFDNSPVAYDRVGIIDPQIVNIVPPKELIEFHIYCIELLEKTFQMQYKKYGFIKGAVMILDLEGLNMDLLSMMDVLKPIIYIDENYYPCCLRRAIIVNAPSIFSIFWNLIKAFLDERVQRKIEVLGSDAKQNETYLKQLIPSRFILPEFGGDCQYKFPKAGPCKDLGLNVPMLEGQVRKIVLQRNAFYKHKIEFISDDAKKIDDKMGIFV